MSSALVDWAEEMEAEMRRRGEENLTAAKAREKMAERARAANAVVKAKMEATEGEMVVSMEAKPPSDGPRSSDNEHPEVSNADAMLAELVAEVKAQLSPSPTTTSKTPEPTALPQLRRPHRPPPPLPAPGIAKRESRRKRIAKREEEWIRRGQVR